MAPFRLNLSPNLNLMKNSFQKTRMWFSLEGFFVLRKPKFSCRSSLLNGETLAPESRESLAFELTPNWCVLCKNSEEPSVPLLLIIRGDYLAYSKNSGVSSESFKCSSTVIWGYSIKCFKENPLVQWDLLPPLEPWFERRSRVFFIKKLTGTFFGVWLFFFLLLGPPPLLLNSFVLTKIYTSWTPFS